MTNPQKKINPGRKFNEYYLKTKKPVSIVCRRFDISRSTFYRWYNRYKQLGFEGLIDIPQIPKSFGNQRITQPEENLILELRKRHRLGPHLLHINCNFDNANKDIS